MGADNRFLDDLSRLMTNAMGVAQGAKSEAETAVRGRIERWLAEHDFVTRDEFEAVRAIALKAQAELGELRAELDALRGDAGRAPAADTPTNDASANDASDAGHTAP